MSVIVTLSYAETLLHVKIVLAIIAVIVLLDSDMRMGIYKLVMVSYSVNYHLSSFLAKVWIHGMGPRYGYTDEENVCCITYTIVNKIML